MQAIVFSGNSIKLYSTSKSKVVSALSDEAPMKALSNCHITSSIKLHLIKYSESSPMDSVGIHVVKLRYRQCGYFFIRAGFGGSEFRFFMKLIN